MAVLKIWKAVPEASHSYSGLLFSVDFKVDGKIKRFLCSALDFFSLEISTEYWICSSGRRVLGMVKASGSELTPLERLVLLAAAQPAKMRRTNPPWIFSILNARIYGIDIQEHGHYSILFYDTDQDKPAPEQLDEEQLNDYLRIGMDYLKALRAVEADAFADNLEAAIQLWLEYVERGQTVKCNSGTFRRFDAAFRSIRPTLEEHLNRWIEMHESEVFVHLPQAELHT